MKRMTASFLSAILAGLCIGLGGTVFLRLKDAFPGGHVAGALFFAVGLFAVCTRGYYLFTGKVCYVFDQKPSYALDLTIFWAGNFVGCILLATIQSCTALIEPYGIRETARQLVAIKMEMSYLSVFLLAVLCNIFIYIAVNGYANNPHQVGKYLAILFGVTVFILSGTEHSVADMYYWTISGILYEEPGESLLRILLISLGNSVGGVLLPLAEKAKARLEAPPAA